MIDQTLTLIFATASSFFYAFTNVFDKHVIEKRIKNHVSYIFTSGIYIFY